MADFKNSSPKRGLPAGFLVFIFAVILFLLTLHSFSSGKMGRVSYSHQLEHLENLHLIDRDQSRKIAVKENLVTFSGQFLDRVSEEGENRFRYLTLLKQEKDLQQNLADLDSALVAFRDNVLRAANYFLSISGESLPEGGYVVVDRRYDTAERKNAIVITQAPTKNRIHLAQLEERFSSLRNSSDLSLFQNDLLTLIQLYQSPSLGIGDQKNKDTLKNLYQEMSQMNASFSSLGKVGTALQSLRAITRNIDEMQEGVRLLPLRSVRSYTEDLAQYALVADQLRSQVPLLRKARTKVADAVWFFNNQEISTNALENQDREAFLQWFKQSKQEWDNFEQNKGLYFKAPDQPINTVLQKRYKSEEPSPNYFGYFFTFLPVILVAMLLYFIFSRQMKGMGSTAMNFGKSPARLLTKEANKVTFKDVAGAEESKEELKEIVDFLRDPSKFTALGAKIPKGVLLVGPPGTGKTLIAKAVAGEANRPFFSISGSDFVEMFVGVGASRIRDMFEQAKKNAPCIIFMDEIDAVGRHRGAGIGGGHDEREQTLNQLLVEMDGFDTREGVILIAATNRPDILDKALLRPGRFDRRVVLDLPDVKGRHEILKVHARHIKIDASVNLLNIAKKTPGSSGADLENILNEAALLAARKGRLAVTEAETREACDKVRFGKERKSLEMDDTEKKTTAYHESGHAIVGLKVDHYDPIDKVTIIPRGSSLGSTHFIPKKNRLGYWKKEVLDILAVLMGGRAAENLFVQDQSSGARQDISHATELARSMVCEWGMSDAVGLVSYDERSESGQYLGMQNRSEKSYSEQTAQQIDAEIHKLLQEAYERAYQIVEEHKEQVQLVTDMLMEFETLSEEDLLKILDGTWDAEEKRQKLKELESLHKIAPPKPPSFDESASSEAMGTPKPRSV
ncbi:MAG: ATP-dependent zinc metalloprotease FtsH [Chlamydiota bacterium]